MTDVEGKTVEAMIQALALRLLVAFLAAFFFAVYAAAAWSAGMFEQPLETLGLWSDRILS